MRKLASASRVSGATPCRSARNQHTEHYSSSLPTMEYRKLWLPTVTKVNVADFMTKSLSWKELHFHSACFFGRFNFGTEVDMTRVKL